MASDFDTYGLIAQGVKRFADSVFIPDSDANADWRQYQSWLADGHTPRPLQPDSTYVWDGTAWVQDPTLANAAHNAPLITQLNANDGDSIRPIRTILLELAKISPIYPQLATAERGFLLNNEQVAVSTRGQIQPQAVLTLAQEKAQRIFELRTQLLTYIRLGFIWNSVHWSCDVTDMIVYITLAGYQQPSNLLTSDGRVHVWDATNTERILTTANASKLAGALYQWLYLSQGEAQAKAAQVQACQSVEEVRAVEWIGKYSAEFLFDADARPVGSGFDKGFDIGYG